jgi:hypothetical protein
LLFIGVVIAKVSQAGIAVSRSPAATIIGDFNTDLTIAADTTYTGDTELRARNLTIQASATITATGTYTIHTAGEVSLFGDIVSQGRFTLIAEEGVTTTQTAQISVGALPFVIVDDPAALPTQDELTQMGDTTITEIRQGEQIQTRRVYLPGVSNGMGSLTNTLAQAEQTGGALVIPNVISIQNPQWASPWGGWIQGSEVILMGSISVAAGAPGGFCIAGEGINGRSSAIILEGDIVRITTGLKTLETGDGGNGAPCAGGGCPAVIKGGAGGHSTVIFIVHQRLIIDPGAALNIQTGDAGNGGNAGATGNNGASLCPIAEKGCNADARAGHAGSSYLAFVLDENAIVEFTTPLSLTGSLGAGGNGGVGTATGGTGGNAFCPLAHSCVAGNGGDAYDRGGNGGDSLAAVVQRTAGIPLILLLPDNPFWLTGGVATAAGGAGGLALGAAGVGGTATCQLPVNGVAGTYDGEDGGGGFP